MSTWGKNTISREQMLTMQSEAVRRVREMQRKADDTLKQSQQNASYNNNNFDMQEKKPQANPKNNSQNQSDMRQQKINNTSEPSSISSILANIMPKRNENSPISKALDALNLDNERIMIMLLIVLLLNDGADYTLILALGYVML